MFRKISSFIPKPGGWLGVVGLVGTTTGIPRISESYSPEARIWKEA